MSGNHLIAHPGVFQNHNNGSEQVQLHIELFTPDDLPAFIEKGRAWAQDPNVKLGDKTLLKVPKGVELIALIKDGEQKIQPPKSTDPKTAIHSELILPLSALNALPADHKQSLPESEAANAKKLQWWLLENVGGQADGTTITGWLCENQVTRVSPWEWPGFVTLEDDTPDEKLIAYQLKIANKLQGEELSTFSNIVAEAQQWPVTKQLLKTIKENVVEDVDVSDSLTPAELTKAYKGYWCAQKISSIAVKTKTEWKKDPARWNALDKIMGHKEDAPNENWLTEKAKIEKLSFWDDVSSVTGNSDGKVWFLNPINLAVIFNNRKKFDPEKFVELYTPKHQVEFGGLNNGVKVTLARPFNQKSKENLKRLAQDIAAYFANNPDEYWISYMAYMLATARLEAYNFKEGVFFTPIAEIISETKAEEMYGSGETAKDSNRAKSMGNTEPGDGYKYRGRGFVQLTWKNNYRGRDNDFFSGALDLVNNPGKAMEWDNAALIMIKGMLKGSFTGKKLSDFIGLNSKNYKSARKIINGTNHDTYIASTAVLFEKLIEDSIE